MLSKVSTLATAGLIACCAYSGAHAYEYGFIGLQQPNGLTHGVTAASPPPGFYAFVEPFSYLGHITGPGAPVVNGVNPSANLTGAAIGALYVPGWEILGAQYSVALFQPFFGATLGTPINFTATGVHNTLIEPVALTWNLKGTPFFARLELGAYVPDGTITGPAGLSNIGTPWVSFQPTFTVSYLGDGWDLTARMWGEINSANYKTGYQSGNVFHAEVTATRKFGNFKFGPIANYAGQISNDKSSAFYGNLIQNNRDNFLGVGAMGGYDFGPVNLEVWAFHDVVANASGGTVGIGANAPLAPRVTSVVARLSFRLWGEDPPAAPIRAKY